MPGTGLEFYPVIDAPLPPQEHLVLLRNPKATKSGHRDSEIQELLGMDRWSSCAIVDTVPDNHLTIDALATVLRNLDAQAGLEDKVTVVAVGGDCTQDNGSQGIRDAKLSRIKAALAAPEAGNKSDTAANLDSKGFSLRELVEFGEPIEVYPLQVTISVGDKQPQVFETLHSTGGGACEDVSNEVNKEGFPKGQWLSEARVVWQAINRTRRRPVELVENNVGIENGMLTDFMVGAGRRVAGGTVRFSDSSLTDPERMTLVTSRRSWPSILGGLAARFIGGGSGYTKVDGGVIRMTFRGLERIQVGGEGVEIHQGTPEQPSDDELVTISVQRAAAMTVLRPPNRAHQLKNARSGLAGDHLPLPVAA